MKFISLLKYSKEIPFMSFFLFCYFIAAFNILTASDFSFKTLSRAKPHIFFSYLIYL